MANSEVAVTFLAKATFLDVMGHTICAPGKDLDWPNKTLKIKSGEKTALNLHRAESLLE